MKLMLPEPITVYAEFSSGNRMRLDNVTAIETEGHSGADWEMQIASLRRVADDLERATAELGAFIARLDGRYLPV